MNIFGKEISGKVLALGIAGLLTVVAVPAVIIYVVKTKGELKKVAASLRAQGKTEVTLTDLKAGFAAYDFEEADVKDVNDLLKCMIEKEKKAEEKKVEETAREATAS